MNNPFAHPYVHLVPLACCLVNAVVLLVCVGTGNVQGIVYNIFFLAFNIVTAYLMMYMHKKI